MIKTFSLDVPAYQPKSRPRQASFLSLQALLSNDVTLTITFNDHVALGDSYAFGGGGYLNVFGDRGRLNAAVCLIQPAYQSAAENRLVQIEEPWRGHPDHIRFSTWSGELNVMEDLLIFDFLT